MASVKQCARGTQLFCVISVIVCCIVYILGYRTRWNDRIDILCIMHMLMFLLLRVGGALGAFPWWPWGLTQDKPVIKSQTSCALQSLSQDIGGFGMFFDSLFMSYILFSLKQDIYGLTFPIINTKSVKFYAMSMIWLLALSFAFALFCLRHACGNKDVELFYVHIIHLLFHGSASLVAGCMIFWSRLLYCNSRSVDIRYHNSGRTINETELNSSVTNIDTNPRKNTKDIALNILLWGSCVFISSIAPVLSSIYLLIAGVNAPSPPVWCAKIETVLTQLFPALISWVIIFKSVKYRGYTKYIKYSQYIDRWYKISNRRNDYIHDTHCHTMAKSPDSDLKLIGVDIAEQGLSNGVSSFEIPSAPHITIAPSINSATVDSRDRILLCTWNETLVSMSNNSNTITEGDESTIFLDESMVVHDRISNDYTLSSSVKVSN